MIEVSCALILNDDGKLLVTQRNVHMKLPFKWEFPGGKIEVDETAEACLVREIFEELSVQLKIITALPVTEHRYPDFSVRLFPFIGKITNGSMVLKEHAAYKWLNKDELLHLDWAEADIPVVRNYLNFTDTVRS